MILEFLQNFNQNNRGDISGTLWATKNIDPELNPGKINISKTMGYRTNTDDKANLEAPAWGFAYSSVVGTTDRYFAVADDRCWETSSANPDAAWTEMSNTPTDVDANSDIIAFNSKIYVATSNYLKSYDANFGTGSFTNINALNASPHSITIYANRLYVSDLNEKIYSMNTSETFVTSGSNTIDLNTTTGESQIITKIEAVSNGIWIATVYSDKSGGEMIFWDGETENIASQRYFIPRGALSMTIVNDRPYIIDSLGRLRVFDGTSFTEVARLPIKDEALDGFNNDDNGRFVHPNGMIRVNEEIYVLVSNKRQDTSEDIIENMPSGVWAWHPDYGFYHKYSFAAVDLNSVSVKDYGGNDLAAVGALFRSDATGGSSVDRDNQSEIMAGIQYYTDETNTKAAIGITDVKNSIQKAGYLVTSQAFPETFDDVWQEVVTLHDKFKNSTDRLVIKFRTSEDDPVYGTATWSSDLILRTNADLSNFEEGDEIEILRGNGAGLCASIKRITNPNDYRITLDENPLSGMSGSCRIRAQKWTKIATQSDTDVYNLRSTLEPKDGAWVQFKLFMVGTGMSPQLFKTYVVSNNQERFK